MALDNIHDETMAGFFDNLVHYINPPKVRRQSYSGGRMQSASGTRHRPKAYNRRSYNNGHSYNYNMFADHHQYNVMDYVRWLNIRGEINYTPDNDQETEFSLNPDAPDHTHSMKSVDIRVQKTKADYQGQPIYRAVFFRNSEPQEGGSGMPYGPGDGFDELANFMLMFHNNYTDSKHYLVPQLYKRDPRTKRPLTNRYGHRIVNKRTAEWVKHQRRAFIKSYHAQWRTYQSAFSTHGMNFNYAVEHKQNKIKPAQHSYIHAQEKRSAGSVAHAGVYKDRGFAKDTKCYQGRWQKNYFYKMSSAHRYFHDDRGLADNLIYSLLKQDRLRSYNGELRIKILPCRSNEQAMKLQKKFRNGGNYHAKKHEFVGIINNYHPCVEFPWKQAKLQTFHASPHQLNKLVGTHDNVWSYTNGKLDNSDMVSLPVKKNKYGQMVFKNNPAIRARVDGSIQTDNETVYAVKDAYVKRPVLQSDNKHQQTVGADRIYLQGDPKSLSKPYKHPDGSVSLYYGAKGKADYSLFSRGKQIAKNSKYGFGWNFSTMGDTVHPKRNELFVFEDPIDALSFYNLHNTTLRHKNCTFLSLGGVGKSYAINDFLKNIDAQPGEFSKVHLCFDNDRAGYQGTERIMASNKNKIAYVHQDDSVSINPVTHTKQTIDVIVPNAQRNVITRKMVPTAPKDIKVKDFNDDCQYMHRLNKYQHVSQRDARKIYDKPDSELNISDYSQMITDKYLDMANSLSDLGHNNGRHMQRLFTQYAAVGQEYETQLNKLNKYKQPLIKEAQALSKRDGEHGHLEKDYLEQPKIQEALNMSPQISNKDAHVKAMAKEYRSMDKFGQDTFMGFMQLAGGKSISPHDLAAYAGRHGQFALSPQTSRDMDINPQTLQPDVKRSVNYTADRISSGQNRKKYTLALQSLQLMMPYYRDKKIRKPLSLQQRQNVKIGSIIYQNVVGSIHSNSLSNMLDADEIKRSVQKYIMPAYAKNHQASLTTAIKTAYQKGPMTLRDWYQGQAESHRPVIKDINRCVADYRTDILKHSSQIRHARAERQARRQEARQRQEAKRQQQAKARKAQIKAQVNQKYEKKYGMSLNQIRALEVRHKQGIRQGQAAYKQNRIDQKKKATQLGAKIHGSQQSVKRTQSVNQKRNHSQNDIHRD